MQAVYLIFAILLLCVAHFCKMLRWKMFVEIYEKPRKDSLLSALSLGYLINYIVPFKLGDIVRAYVAGRKMKNGFAFSAATIIIDRYLDVVVVGGIFVVYVLTGNQQMVGSAVFYIGMSAALIVLALAAFIFSGWVKKALRLMASIFNNKIEFFLLKFSWSLIWNFKDIFLKIKKMKLFVYTVVMWGLYLSSYYFFAAYLSSYGNKFNMTDVFTMLFSQSSFSAGTAGAVFKVNNMVVEMPVIMFFYYMVIPLVIILAVAFIIKYFAVNEKTADSSGEKSYINLLPHVENKDRLMFLESYFSNDKRDYIKNYLIVNQNVSIIRDYSAGSNATTMLCMDGEKTFFRKYAFEKDSDKLYEQILWLKEQEGRLPLPEIIRDNHGIDFCFYDMEYHVNAIGMFQYIHSKPQENSLILLKRVLECLEINLYKPTLIPDSGTLNSYLDEKVYKNLDLIKKSKKLKGLLEYSELIVNGTTVPNITYFAKYLEKERLKKIFAVDRHSVIHGDLTIENIICVCQDDVNDSFYIIDPNTGNLWNSPNLDYGKLLQSLHGGYEFLMATPTVEVENNKITYIASKSSAYSYLFEEYHRYLVERFTQDQVKSVYYHEIIHWLRLMPYKLDKDSNHAILFYVGMLMVMKDVEELFERNN